MLENNRDYFNDIDALKAATDPVRLRLSEALNAVAGTDVS